MAEPLTDAERADRAEAFLLAAIQFVPDGVTLGEVREEAKRLMAERETMARKLAAAMRVVEAVEGQGYKTITLHHTLLDFRKEFPDA